MDSPAVAVFCGSSLGSRPSYAAAARQVAAYCAEAKADLVFGGSAVGLMGVMCDEAAALGVRTIGITPQHLADIEPPSASVGELVLVEDMHERKRRMMERSDAVLVLPGGVGSLDEAFEAITWRQIGLHEKPIVFADIDGYWGPLRALVDHMQAEGFVSAQVRANFTLSASLDDAFRVIGAALRSRGAWTDGPNPN
ncbi:TIGR00730 family Rossman fold protein [Streptomyces sp. NBC_00669]|nr:TIGR00730 family Rossman fold protein [Streptomyces sp. NBC_00669]